MKKYDLVVVGPSKTGTHSIFEMLSHHPEVCAGKRKTKINRNGNVSPDLFLKTYFEEINNRTKVVVDAAVSPYSSKVKKEYLRKVLQQEWMGELKLIYSVRNPLDRLVSNLKQILEDFSNIDDENGQENNPNFNRELAVREVKSWFNKDLTVREEAFKLVPLICLDSGFLRQAKEFTDHIHITNLYDFNVASTLNFLEIEPIELKFKNLNKSELINENINLFIHRNKDYFKKMFTTDLQQIQHLFKVDLTSVIKEINESYK